MPGRTATACLGAALLITLTGCGPGSVNAVTAVNPAPAQSGQVAAGGTATSGTAPAPGGTTAPGTSAASTVPAVPALGRTLFGVLPDLDHDSPAGYVARTGLHPAVYGDFAAFPLTADEAGHVRATAALVRAQGAALSLTLEPKSGLASVTPAAAAATAQVLAEVNASGVPVYLRFAHEMNGTWYAWGQQPVEYVAAFRTLASAVHAAAPTTYLVWSPNYGSGYPFTGGQYAAKPGTADFAALDTNHDGKLTMNDDMYAPYYPGDSSVDWVGLTLYFFGISYPWAENEVPDAGRFAAQLRGTYRGVSGDERAIPDFYTDYAVKHARPMAISETAAWFNTGRADGASQSVIEKAWIDQVYSAQVRTAFPRLALVSWFEHSKFEDEAHGVVDWRATYDPAVLADLKARLAAAPSAYVFATP